MSPNLDLEMSDNTSNLTPNHAPQAILAIIGITVLVVVLSLV